VCGASHEKLGQPCQDAHQWAAIADGVLVAALADGAGSAPLAQVGATLAVGAAVDSLCRGDAQGRKDVLHWRELLNNALAAAKSAVEAEANIRSIPAAHLASTLILVAAGPRFVAATQIGDGAVVAADAEGKFFSITRPAASEYLNETVFLTSTEALPSAQSAVWQGALANLAILSDGLQMAALRMPGGEPHPGFFTPLFQFLAQQSDGTAAQEALTSFLRSPRLRQRTDDDVTLVMATLVSGGSDATAALI
jgi:hypothetical protein